MKGIVLEIEREERERERERRERGREREGERGRGEKISLSLCFVRIFLCVFVYICEWEKDDKLSRRRCAGHVAGGHLARLQSWVGGSGAVGDGLDKPDASGT